MTEVNQAGGASARDRVLAIVSEALADSATIGLETSLRDGGLSSLAVTRIRFALRAEFGVDLSMRQVGNCRTAGELLALVGPSAAAGSFREPETIPSHQDREATSAEPFPLTDIQQSYLLGTRPELTDDPVGCRTYREFAFTGLDIPRLSSAWQQVVARHDMLRIQWTADGRQQVGEPGLPTPITVHQLTDADEQGFAEHRRQVGDRLCQAPEAPYLVELSLGPRGAQVVHLGLDLAVTDGVGLQVILSDWWRLYQAEPLAELDPALSPRRLLASLPAGRDPDGRHAAYWRRRLTDLPPGPRAARASAAGNHRHTLQSSVSATQWLRVTELAEAWEVSPTALVLTLFAELFAHDQPGEPFSLVLTTNERTLLPRAADAVVGPFTSSMLVPMADTCGQPLREAAQDVHSALWADLEHSSISGIAALRALGGHRPPGPGPSVVFTSMLGSPAPETAEGFGPAMCAASTRTSEVCIDHQMWEAEGALHIRWDVSVDRIGGTAGPLLFNRLLDQLHDLDSEPPARRNLNELQQSYFVPRATRPPGEWDGCQVYSSFQVTGLDIPRLEAAWLTLCAAHESLRTRVGCDGMLEINARAPERRHIAVLDLRGIDPAPVHATLRADLAGRAPGLGRGPHSAVVVTRESEDDWTVHLSSDLTVLDGRSIHLLIRELFRHYADPEALPISQRPYAEWARRRQDAGSAESRADWERHWAERVRAVLPGPALVPATQSAGRSRERREAVIDNWPAVRRLVRARGLDSDDLLATAFADALATEFEFPFSLPVVRWTDESGPYRPGEYTALSWLTYQPGEPEFWKRAEQAHALVARDRRADGVSGLAMMRRHALRARREGNYELAVVYTGVLNLFAQQLPPGVSLGSWLTCTPDVALDCISIDEGDRLRLYFDADPSRFADGQLDRIFTRYRDFVAALGPAAGVSVPAVESLPEPSEQFYRTVVHEWNDTAHPFADDHQVQVLFERQARLRPDAVALRWSAGTMSFAELDAAATRLAWRLRSLDVRAQVPVGVSVRRGPDMAIAVFGVLKAGGCYVPVEASMPAGRAEAVLQDAGVALVVVSEGGTDWAVPPGVRQVDVRAMGQSEVPLPRDGAVTDTAYVIFTSGSTGRPKGVAVSHRPLLNLIDWCARTHGFSPADLGLSVTSLGFDLSVFDLLGVLGSGGGLYLADPHEQRDPRLLLDILLREPITFWNSAPTTLNQLAPLLAGCRDAPGTDTLRLVYLSGDYTPLTLPDEVRAAFPRARMISLGGATEATVWSNYFEIEEIDPSWHSIPYGRPISNARYYILDERLRPCPVGVEGDLFIGGECLSQGYYRRPELTAERFIADPFVESAQALMYRTGDRASYFADGVICFLGRLDSQVKIRGFRVELAEIEHRLRSHDAVKDVVVLARPHGDGDRKLVAYVIAAGPDLPGVPALRRYAGLALPDYMVPNVVVFIDTLPATANGKLDRDALPWPAEPGSVHQLGPATAALPAEPDATLPAEPDAAGELLAELADTFRTLLGLSELDVDRDVWDLGATSFTMVQVAGVLEKARGRRISVAVMLANPTVRGIASAIVAEQPAGAAAAGLVTAGPPEPTGTPGGVVTDPLPLFEPVFDAAERLPTIDFFDAAAREAFKRARPDLRVLTGTASNVALDKGYSAGHRLRARASRREFADRALTRSELGRLLDTVRETEQEGRSRRLYPSAGDTYAVRVYLDIRAGRVQGVEAGLYYYHPVEHALQLVTARSPLERSMHFVYNRPVFDGCAFQIFLFGSAAACEPIYGPDSDRFMALEAGYLGQVLLEAQTTSGIGLCPVGNVVLDAVRAGLALTADERYLQSFLGGPLLDEPARTADEPARTADEPQRSETAVPIVGVAGRYAGADDVEALWSNLSTGVRSLIPVPPARVGQIARAGQPAPAGGYLEDIDGFDSLLFKVAPREAALLDPQLRLS
ncbi:amino acid adenylation domain-containing protein, partial [Jatrophihabitans sp.]|uniref:amino acid adenylation domain-containing protein n=1 Tax=Jatrophihabitans sp. TaxID=1932789 RepID=UPI002EF8CEC6